MLFEKRQQIAICTIALMLVAVFVLLWYLPSYKRLKALERAKTEQMLALDRARNRQRQLPAMKKKLLELQKATKNFDKKIPEHRGLGEFLQRIANLMNQHNLTEQQITPGREINADALSCLSVDMKCKGTLKQLFEFYRSLQEMDRLVRIEQVKLINDRDFKGQVSMQTKASIYYRTNVNQG